MTDTLKPKKLRKKITESLSIIARNYADIYLCKGEWMGGPEPYAGCIKRINPFILFGAMYQAYDVHEYFVKATESELKAMIVFTLKTIFDRVQDYVEEIDYEYDAIVENAVIKACEEMVKLNYNHPDYETE